MLNIKYQQILKKQFAQTELERSDKYRSLAEFNDSIILFYSNSNTDSNQYSKQNERSETTFMKQTKIRPLFE